MRSLLIGISAYNEETNIARLLEDISGQVFPSDISIEEIVVISDGSSDKTVQLASKSQLPKLKVLDDGQRLGLAARLNQVFDRSHSDVVILLNADIRLAGQHCLALLLEPIVTGKADLTSCPIIAAPTNNFFQQALGVSMECKNEVFDSYLGGDNVYTCHGPARAFSRRLYTKMRFPHSVGEDAYSYLYAKKHGFQYTYVPEAKVVYQLPATLADHQKQSHRYTQSKEQFVTEFGPEFVTTAYYLPKSLVGRAFAKYLLKSPVSVVLYLVVMGLISVTGWRRKPIPTAWSIASSSKK